MLDRRAIWNETASPFLHFIIFDIVIGKNISGIRLGLSLRKPYICRLSIMESKRQRGCMRARTMAGTSQSRARMEHLVNSLACSSSNVIIEKRRVTKRLSKEAMRAVSLSERLCFMESIQLVQENVLASTYIIVISFLLH